MKLQHTTAMEAFFAMFMFCFSFMMMVAASPTYNYTFLFSHKVCCRVMHIVVSHTRHAQPSNTFSTLRCLCTLASSLLFARFPCACMTVTPMRGLGGIHVRVCVHVYEHSFDWRAFSEEHSVQCMPMQAGCPPSPPLSSSRTRCVAKRGAHAHVGRHAHANNHSREAQRSLEDARVQTA